jgi:acetyl esterase
MRSPGIVGRTYLERGQPVVVRCQWRSGARGTPRNVLVERAGGTLVVRPFRGLRRLKDDDQLTSRSRPSQ